MTRAPRWLWRLTAPLRRDPRPRWAAVRLALYAASVLGVLCWALTAGGALWEAAVLAAVPAVVLSPAALLAVECLRSPGRGTRRGARSRRY